MSVHGSRHVVGPADTACGAALVEADGPRAGGDGCVTQQDGGVQCHHLAGGHEGLVVVVAGDAVGAAAAVESLGRFFVVKDAGGGVDGVFVAEPVGVLAEVQLGLMFLRLSYQTTVPPLLVSYCSRIFSPSGTSIFSAVESVLALPVAGAAVERAERRAPAMRICLVNILAEYDDEL